MKYDNFPNIDRFDLQQVREALEKELPQRPDRFDEARFVDLIQDSAILLAKITTTNYSTAQQIVLNYCLQVLSSQMPRENQQHILDRIQKLIVSGADVNSFYNPTDKSDPQHELLPVAQKINAWGINQTPLMLAVKAMNIPVIALLKNYGADLTIQDNDGNTALILAVKTRSMQSFDIVKTLVDPKEKAEHVSFSEALQVAKEDWQECPLDVLNFCIKPFFDNGINIQNKNGDTALMYAAKNQDYASVNYLIENGADTRLQNNEGKTAFELAPIDTPVKGLLSHHAH